MKIKVLYEDNIKNGHKNYTTIEIPDGDYSIMLDIDYEQRLAEAKPEKKGEVKRCETVQEMFDLLNSKEYNNWRKFDRHWGFSKAKPNEEGEEVDTSEPLMKEVSDDRVFRRDEIIRDCQNEYNDVCQGSRMKVISRNIMLKITMMLLFQKNFFYKHRKSFTAGITFTQVKTRTKGFIAVNTL